MAINWQALLGIDRLRESARYWVDEGSIAVADRVELARLEWHTQRQALIWTVLAAALGLFFLSGFLILASVVALLHWNGTEHWVTAFVSVLLAWALLGVATLLVVFKVSKRLAQPFALTRKVLAEDLAELKERL
ncbi:phage holin family protein [Corticibacter populi]|uniref:phage holin family protein n=1 Tax=Corticibacter populi TaxID=1550736 RepID=UPI0010EF7B9F|nr:phage holin family protein [Corticibacter populi]RZS30741.1 putative superfamily III holin-X [Corticibacter populi]